MKRNISILLVFCMVLCSFSAAYATGIMQNSDQTKVNVDNGTKTLYVSPNGTDRNDGLTPDKPKRNIEHAIEAVNPGDTVQLAPGTYSTPITLNKSIILTGTNRKQHHHKHTPHR